MQEQYSEFVLPSIQSTSAATSHAAWSQEKSRFRSLRARPNPSFKRTRSGRPLQAFISFSALRALPPRAAQLKR